MGFLSTQGCNFPVLTYILIIQACNALSTQDAWDYFNVGPPYALHLDDFTNMLPFWMNFTRDTRRAVPELIAEMYAYSLAASHLGLKHIRLNSLIVSDVRPSSYGKWRYKLDHQPLVFIFALL